MCKTVGYIGSNFAEIVVVNGLYTPSGTADRILVVPATSPRAEPIMRVLPLQMLAYLTAVLKGCDVDEPRNLARSVTVE